MTAIGTTAGNRRGRLEYFHSRKERCGKPVFSASFCVGVSPAFGEPIRGRTGRLLGEQKE